MGCVASHVDVDTASIVKGEIDGDEVMRVSALTTQGRRPYQEDCYAVQMAGAPGSALSDMHFFGVFDGHGGAAISKFCEEYFYKEFVGRLNGSEVSKMESIELEEVIFNTFFALDAQTKTLPNVLVSVNVPSCLRCLHEPSEYLKPCEEIGTTATTVFVTSKYIIFAHVGDSRGILIRDNAVHFETHDHQPSDGLERIRIEDAGGFVERGRVEGMLAVARAIGDGRFKQHPELPAHKQMVSAEPDIEVIKRSEGDQFIVLASDGLWAVYTSEEVCDFISYSITKLGDSLQGVCERLMEACVNRKYSCDNVTILIIQVSNKKIELGKVSSTNPSSNGNAAKDGQLSAMQM